VPEEDRARVFERFFTTDADRRGTGLGLAIARAVAEAHGGSVRYEPRVPRGSRFVLTLPAARRTT
jgi:two-component system sensor histidine kinase ChvG